MKIIAWEKLIFLSVTFALHVAERESLRLTERELKDGTDPLSHFPLKNL